MPRYGGHNQHVAIYRRMIRFHVASERTPPLLLFIVVAQFHYKFMKGVITLSTSKSTLCLQVASELINRPPHRLLNCGLLPLRREYSVFRYGFLKC